MNLIFHLLTPARCLYHQSKLADEIYTARSLFTSKGDADWDIVYAPYPEPPAGSYRCDHHTQYFEQHRHRSHPSYKNFLECKKSGKNFAHKAFKYMLFVPVNLVGNKKSYCFVFPQCFTSSVNEMIEQQGWDKADMYHNDLIEKQDCQWETWGEWSLCKQDAQRQEAQRKRTRQLSSPAKNPSWVEDPSWVCGEKSQVETCP